jgi:hypothetical protein
MGICLIVSECIEESRELVMETCWDEWQKLSGQIVKRSIKGSMCHASHSREIQYVGGGVVGGCADIHTLDGLVETYENCENRSKVGFSGAKRT